MLIPQNEWITALETVPQPYRSWLHDLAITVSEDQRAVVVCHPSSTAMLEDLAVNRHLLMAIRQLHPTVTGVVTRCDPSYHHLLSGELAVAKIRQIS